MEKIRKRRKKRKHSKLKWVILGIPISIMALGAAIVGYFGWELTKQTVLLAHTVLVPYKPSDEEIQFNMPTWSRMPEFGENIGDLKIPALDLMYPVVEGTGEKELKRGVGHYAGSLLPGQGGHVVLSGHRNTVFTKLKDLKKGDQIIFATPYGEFIYEATEFKIVHADDKTVIVPTKEETLTLTTCYPFEYIGNAPDRYIVYTKLVSKPNI